MNSDVLGGGLALALAAGLWFIYLLPTWLRRREYLASERNALRLQQTLRIMAQTTQIPEQFTTEMSARAVAEQQRRLRRQIQKEEAMAKARDAAEERQTRATVALANKIAHAERAAIAERDALRMPPAARVSPSRVHRLRRSKLATTLVVAVTLVVTVAAAFLAAWGVVLLGVIVIAAGLLLLRSVNRTAARLTAPAIVTRAHGNSPLIDHAQLAQAHQSVSRGWVPTEVPKPLYLSRPIVDTDSLGAISAQAANQAADLKEASLRSEQSLRDAQQAVPTLTPEVTEAEAPVPSRFAGMGYVDSVDKTELPNLDEVLRRRRAG